jgi:ABC-type phosphate/phosphonate transport system substrate-binding protein
VIVARRPLSVEEWSAEAGTRAAVNSFDSLSGWVSLCAVWGGRPPTVVETGAHSESLRAVAEGAAELASIDAVSWEHLRAVAPRTASSVHVVGHGPTVPSLPLICALGRAATVPAIRSALGAVVTDPAFAPVARRLRIRGFVPFERSDFDGLRALAPPVAG